MDATILEAIPGANPSGANLRYEAIYAEIRARVRMARGEVVPDPDDPDFVGLDVEWRFVIGACRDLLRRRSKDLMLAAWLTEAQLAVDGFAGLRDGLDILRGLAGRFWETLYPEIEDGDAEARVQVFEWMDSRLAEAVAQAYWHAESEDAATLPASEAEILTAEREREQPLLILIDCRDSLIALEDTCSHRLGEPVIFPNLRSAVIGAMREAFGQLLVKMHSPDATIALRGGWDRISRGSMEDLLRYRSGSLALSETWMQADPDDERLHANEPPDAGPAVRSREMNLTGGKGMRLEEDVWSQLSVPEPRPASPQASAPGEFTRLLGGSPPAAPAPSSPPVPSQASPEGVGAAKGGFREMLNRAGRAVRDSIARSFTGTKVDFTLTAPGMLAAGTPFELFVWAHESRERARVLARAREELRSRDLLTRTKGPFELVSGTVLRVRLSIPGAAIAEPDDTIVWEEETTCASFVVTLPEKSLQAKWPGAADIYANGLRVARISFVLSVEQTDGEFVEAACMRYRKAFASYASADRDAVIGRIQGMHKILPELEVFLDVVSLRSGQNWEQELWRVIPASDIFYLFWSSHARESEWVEKEWRCALRERGIEFIDPIPLQSPQESPPPVELSSLHFNDWELAFRRGKPPA